MPKAGEPYPLQVFVGDDAGDGVPDLLEADFALPAVFDDEAVVLDVVDFVEVGDGFYTIFVTMPATTGRLRIDPAMVDPTDGTCDPEVFEGDVTAFTMDDVAAIAARPPSISLASNVGKNAAFTIEVFKGDARTLEIPIYDEDGALLDLSGFNSFRFSIQNADQTVVAAVLPYNQTTGITGTVGGMLLVDLPEDCSAYDLLEAGETSVTVYWSADGDPNDDDLTRTLRAGRFVIKRKETPSP